MNIKEKFLSQFIVVFKEDFSVRNCGRDNCIRLIELASYLNPEVNFGDCASGIMDTDKIISLYNEILN